MINESKLSESTLNFKIILLGDSSVGKTCFIKQYIDHQFNEQSKPTCCVDFVPKTCQVDQFSVKLNIFDTAGQERYRSLTRSYFKGTDAVLFLYDMNNKESFLNVGTWVEYFQKESQTKEGIRVLVGTKKDKIISSLSSKQNNKEQYAQKQTIEKEDIKQLVEKYKFLFKFETSAKQNINIEIVFEELTRNLIYNRLQRKKSANPICQEQWSIILKRDKQHLMKQEQKKKGCC